MDQIKGRTLSTNAAIALENASTFAGEIGDDQVGCGHIVSAILRLEGSSACVALNRLGVTKESFGREILQALDEGKKRAAKAKP